MRLVILLLLAMCSSAFADNKIRIEELNKEGQQLLTQRNQLLDQTKNLEVRIMELNGAIKELTSQDESSKNKLSK
jgi:septal ring factor EnvC (AmiA/AmiB activator)